MQKEFSVWSLFSDDDNVCLFLTEAAALKTKDAWDKAAANYIRGPFEHNITVKITGKKIELLSPSGGIRVCSRGRTHMFIREPR
jgi:hypothetical protein